MENRGVEMPRTMARVPKRSYWGVAAALVLSSSQAAAEPLLIGTTFSPKQCAYLALDSRAVYQETLAAGFDLIRLGAYWDEIEPREGVYQFDELDWYLAQARAKGTPVILTVGMKAPRWPEYFIPPWALRRLRLPRGSEVSYHPHLREWTLRAVAAVIRRYREEPIIQAWQIENEPFDRAGPGHWWISRAFVDEEIALVKQLDTRQRPILINAATHSHRWLRLLAWFFLRHKPVTEALAAGDVLGLNVYPVVSHQWPWKKSYYWTTPEERHRHLSSILQQAADRDKPVVVTELQAEPWEPGHLVYSDERRPPTGRPEALPAHVQELHALGLDMILLWGVEYWEFRKLRYGDQAWWNEVRNLLQQRNAKSP